MPTPGRRGDLPNRLSVILTDGEVHEDKDVTQENGLIESSRLRIALPHIPQAAEYGWRSAESYPIKEGSGFLVARESPAAEEQDRYMGAGLDSMYGSEMGLNSRNARKKLREYTALKWLVIAIFAFVALFGLVLFPMIKGPVAEVDPAEAEAGGPSGMEVVTPVPRPVTRDALVTPIPRGTPRVNRDNLDHITPVPTPTGGP